MRRGVDAPGQAGDDDEAGCASSRASRRAKAQPLALAFRAPTMATAGRSRIRASSPRTVIAAGLSASAWSCGG